MAESGSRPRDALGVAFLALHIAILIYILIGWALPLVGFYVVFLPVMVLHWPLNRNSCALNNLESLVRTGLWRDPENCEEGAWLQTLIRSATGLNFTVRQTDRLSYGLLTLLWGLGWWHWLAW